MAKLQELSKAPEVYSQLWARVTANMFYLQYGIHEGRCGAVGGKNATNTDLQ